MQLSRRLLLFHLSCCGLASTTERSTCFDDPSSPRCASYEYKNASTDLSAICTTMASMSACSVHAQCPSGGARGETCDEFGLLHSACNEMPGMPRCAPVSKLCANGTAVRMCSSPADIAEMPTTSEARAAALNVCASMPTMEACSSCTSSPTLRCPDPLLSVSRLCAAMPGMAACARWEAWCRLPGATASLPAFCAGVPAQGGDGVQMRMYFHTGWQDYILFQNWVPKSLSAYVLACLGVLSAGVSSAALRGVRLIFEAHSLSAPRTHDHGWAHILRANAARAGLVTISTALDYALMLVAMTFNVGLFLCVCFGLGLGTLLFGHWGRVPSKAQVSVNRGDNAEPFLAHASVPVLESQVSGGCH